MVKIFDLSRVNLMERMTEPQPAWLMHSTASLVSECIAGNEAAIELFVRHYETSVFRLALSVVGDEAEANEITQETFIAALRALPSYQDRKSLKAWLYTIALNRSRSHLRKRKTLERLRNTLNSIFHVEVQKLDLPEETILQHDKEAQIWKALNQLDEPFRIVVVLRYFHELPIAEISEILSVNEGTIHSRLHTARDRLRAALNHLHGE